MKQRTRAQVLAEFDRAIGLDVTPRVGSVDAASQDAARQDAATANPTAPGRPITVEPRPAFTAAVVADSATLLQSSGRAAAGSSDAPTMQPGSWNLDARWLVDPGTVELRAARLAEVRAAHDERCPHCTTATAHTQTVFGEGNPAAEILFVGEAPGETEDTVGRPFVGRAGQKLDEMIRAMGLKREDVYIANVLKSRPPENRTPLQHEVDACGPFLVAQILAIRPRVIVTLGGPATKLVLAETLGITRLRGLWREWIAPTGAEMEPVAVMPTYHPAYLLRNYTVKVRGEVWSDLKQVLTRLGRTAPNEDKSESK